MAKKLAGQQQFEGDGFPDPAPQEVCEARDEYLSAMRRHAEAGEHKSACHESLIAVMHKHDITRVPLDGENKFFEIEPRETIKTKTVPKEKRDQRTQAEVNA